MILGVLGGLYRFNSRAHGGRDIRWSDPQYAVVVSIHAPTGGATSGNGSRGVKLRVSIHAPTGGATTLRVVGTAPTSVSIHAPTGGATEVGTIRNRLNAFQFTRPRGARQNGVKTSLEQIVSIHAPTGGATHARARHAANGGRFNSRAHGGRDTIYFIIFRGGNARGIFREPPFINPLMF